MVKQGYKQTEVGMIPKDWEVASIYNAYLKARIGWQGLTTDEYLTEGEYYLVTGTDFKNNQIDWGNCSFVDKSRYNQDKYIQLNIDDLLITKDGTIGKIAFIGCLPKLATLNSGIFVLRPKFNDFKPLYLFYIFQGNKFKKFLEDLTAGSTIVHLYQKDFIKFLYPIPSLPEQERIAETLSDADTLISLLEKMIAKKKAIKQGVMQEFFNGKKHLDGFSGEWVEKKLGDVCNICRGGSPRPIQEYLTTSDKGINWIKIGDVDVNAKYIVSTQEKITEEGTTMSRRVYTGDFILSNSMSFGRPYILKIDGCIHDGWLAIQCYKDYFNTDFLYYVLSSEYVFSQYIQIAAGSGVQNLNKVKVARISILLPSLTEQTAIANILSDMDSEIEVLEKKLIKYRQIKQGMMQQLLTGKIRLFESASTEQSVGKIFEIPQEHQKQQGHNQQFDDAVAIAAIVNAFYSDKYPLGRKKVQKLLYLLRRKQDASVAKFKKKAAGPYADEVRYKGGELIAEKNGYIVVTKGKSGSTFAKGKKIGSALAYVNKWEMQSNIDWLVSQFIYTKVDKLELLATVDMAICDLENDGIAVSVDSIKKLIKSNKEWKAKLSKTYFSDQDIAFTIGECKKMFG